MAVLVRWLRDRGGRATIPDVTDCQDARELLTVSDMAERCHVSRQTIYAWIAEGRLVPVARYRYGDQWAPLFNPEDAIGRRDRRRKTHA